MPQVVLIDMACEKLEPVKLEELARAWGLPDTPFLLCPLPGEDPFRQRLAVDGYMLKPVSRLSLWDVLRQFGEDVDRVLVVDDDRDFVQLLVRMLGTNPVRRYRVITAYGGEEALAIMRTIKPDLILLDLGLPDLDGLQIIDRIRSTPMWEQIPIVVITGQDGLENLRALTGTLLITKAGGIMPGEVVQWVQKVLDTTIRTSPPQKGGNGLRVAPM